MIPEAQKAANYPGLIALADARGSYPGCCAVELRVETPNPNGDTLASLFNAWAAEHPHHLIVYLSVAADNRSATLLYTKQLSAEEQADLQEVADVVSETLKSRREQRAAEKQKMQEAREAGRKETLRLAGVGKEYEARLAKVKAMPDSKEKKAAMKELQSGASEAASEILNAPPAVEEEEDGEES